MISINNDCAILPVVQSVPPALCLSFTEWYEPPITSCTHQRLKKLSISHLHHCLHVCASSIYLSSCHIICQCAYHSYCERNLTPSMIYITLVYYVELLLLSMFLYCGGNNFEMGMRVIIMTYCEFWLLSACILPDFAYNFNKHMCLIGVGIMYDP